MLNPVRELQKLAPVAVFTATQKIYLAGMLDGGNWSCPICRHKVPGNAGHLNKSVIQEHIDVNHSNSVGWANSQ